jgi:hypothetical protein
MNEWQPIETAPKDEVPVLLYCKATTGEMLDDLEVALIIGSWNDQAEAWESNGELINWMDPSCDWPKEEQYELEPIYWRHLPSLPDLNKYMFTSEEEELEEDSDGTHN